MRIPRPLFISFLPLLLGWVAGSSLAEPVPVILKPDASDRVLESMTDKPLDKFRVQLLELAFDTATAIPVQPHIKTRSQKQEEAFDACLKLDQAGMAARYIKRIDDWRRGAVYGDLALYCLRNDRPEGVTDLLDMASQIAKTADQDWRKSTILAKVAKAKVWLGQLEEANKLEAGLEVAEQGAVAEAQAEKHDEKMFAEQMKWVMSSISSGKHDEIENAMGVSALLYDTYFKDPERRKQVEEQLRAAWKAMPLFMRINALLGLASFCVENQNSALGLEYVNEAQSLVDASTWPASFYVPLMGRVVTMRARCGDVEGARRDADKIMAFFEKNRFQIKNFEQAGAICPIAEAYKVMGDSSKSLEIYHRVVEVGAVNPNARCRAEDLTTTCLSMAMNAVEPDGELWKQMRQIRAGLDNPW